MADRQMRIKMSWAVMGLGFSWVRLSEGFKNRYVFAIILILQKETMGREHKKRRRMVIRQKQNRQAKLKKLRSAYAEAKTSSKKDQILAKLAKTAPWLSQEEFLAPLKK